MRERKDRREGEGSGDEWRGEERRGKKVKKPY